jgi:hypothetical protein
MGNRGNPGKRNLLAQPPCGCDVGGDTLAQKAAEKSKKPELH